MNEMSSLTAGVLWKNIVTALLLASALALIAIPIDGSAREKLSRFPQLVHERLVSFGGAI